MESRIDSSRKYFSSKSEGRFFQQPITCISSKKKLTSKEGGFNRFFVCENFYIPNGKNFLNFTRCEPMLFIFFFVTLFVNKPYKMILWSISRGCESTVLGFYLDQVCHLISDMQKWGNLSE